MTLHALGPYYLELLYHSLDAPHSAQINTLDWSPVDSGSGFGSFET